MSRHLRFRWPELEISLRIELLDDLNPDLTGALWNAVPLQSIQSHAVVAGQQIYFPTRLILPNPETAFSEPMNEQVPGRINFEPFFQYIAINYGPMTEPVPAWPLGQVWADDQAKLIPLGKQIWENLLFSQEFLTVIVEQITTEGAPVQAAPSPASPAALPSETNWLELLAYLETETEAIWLVEPEDVKALRLGVLGSEAGVYDQYFSPWIMVSGLVRSLAVVELASLIRLCKNDDFSVEHLTTLLREMLRVPLGVMGYFGLTRLGAVLETVDRVASHIDRRNDFEKFIRTLFSYVNRYNLWLHQTFPWHLSTLYAKPSLEDAQSILDLSSKLQH